MILGLAALLLAPLACAPVQGPVSSPVVPQHCSYGHASNGEVLPDRSCTPGVADPRVTQANISQTICRSGYTATVRPPESYTSTLKRQQMQQYAAAGQPGSYEEDHLISLELGGDPTSPFNLWPQPGASPNAKDRVEDELHQRVCAGTLTLAEAQRRIATDWTLANS